MLTDTKIRTLKPRDTAYRVADTNGLCIEVRPSGAKAWRYRYRYAGKPSIITMAEYPAMGLAEARSERDRLRALVKGGGNPANAARIERAAKIEQAETTFGAIAAELLAKRAKEGLSPGSVKRERRLIEKDMAVISEMPITEVTAPLLLASLRSWKDGAWSKRPIGLDRSPGVSFGMPSQRAGRRATLPTISRGRLSNRRSSTLPA